MLNRMSAKQLLEWRAYASLEPWGEQFNNWLAAGIRQMIFNTQVKLEDRQDVSEFLLKFGGEEEQKPQTWEEQMMLVKIIAEQAAGHYEEG